MDVATTLPFENVISVLSLSATEIYEALENGVRQAGEAGGEFPQISGMRFKFCVSLPVGERITSVEIFDGANFVPIKYVASKSCHFLFVPLIENSSISIL